MIKSRLKKGGVIINMGSIEAVMPLKEELAHYDISKAGIMVLSRALASEYGKHGFRINVLVPGGIWTSGTKSLAKEAMKLKLKVVKTGIEYSMRTPQGRMGKPDEIARMALVLASDLSSYVNGTLIVVDGGILVSIKSSSSAYSTRKFQPMVSACLIFGKNFPVAFSIVNVRAVEFLGQEPLFYSCHTNQPGIDSNGARR